MHRPCDGDAAAAAGTRRLPHHHRRPSNADPYPPKGAIKALAKHFGIALERERCFPYQRN